MDSYDKNWMDRIRDAFRDSPLMRSGLVTILALGGVLTIIILVWNAHLNGTLHNAFAVKYEPDKPTGARLGGMDLIRLNRLPMAANLNPEFLTAILAPGIGMQVLQASINVPSRGEVSLLQSTGMDNSGRALANATGTPIMVLSAGRTDGHWDKPVNLLDGRPADRMSYTTTPDGGESDALFAGIPKTGRTNSNGVQTNVSVTLSNHALDLTVIARNVTDEPRAVTLRWDPRFLFPSGGIGSLMLVPPISEGTPGSVNKEPPVALGARDLNTVYSKLKHGYLGNGPDAQLRNDADGYILHLVALSPSVRSLHVQSALNGDSVLLSFSTGITGGGEDEYNVLKPGDALQLHLRLEVTSIASGYAR